MRKKYKNNQPYKSNNAGAGGAVQGTNPVNDGFMRYKNQSILPSPAILESYEELAPGMVEQLIKMVEIEQKHRHIYEKQHLKTLAFNNLRNQVLGLMLILSILFFTYRISMTGDNVTAATTSILGFLFLFIVHFKRFKPGRDSKTRREGKKY